MFVKDCENKEVETASVIRQTRLKGSFRDVNGREQVANTEA